MTRATAQALWLARTGEPFSPSDAALVAPSAPPPPCRARCGWCEMAPCPELAAAMRRRAS